MTFCGYTATRMTELYLSKVPTAVFLLTVPTVCHYSFYFDGRM